MLLLPCTFLPSIPPFLLPTDNPPCDVHFSDSVPVLVVCLVFVFVAFLFKMRKIKLYFYAARNGPVGTVRVVQQEGNDSLKHCPALHSRDRTDSSTLVIGGKAARTGTGG